MKKRYYIFTIISLFITAPLATYCALVKPSEPDLSSFIPNIQDADISSNGIELHARNVQYNGEEQIVSKTEIHAKYGGIRPIVTGKQYSKDIDTKWISIKKEDFSVSVFKKYINVSFCARNKQLKPSGRFHLTLSLYDADDTLIDTIQTPISSMSEMSDNTEDYIKFDFRISRESSSEEGMDRYEVQIHEELTNNGGINFNISSAGKLSILCLFLVVSFFFIYKNYFSKIEGLDRKYK